MNDGTRFVPGRQRADHHHGRAENQAGADEKLPLAAQKDAQMLSNVPLAGPPLGLSCGVRCIVSFV